MTTAVEFPTLPMVESSDDDDVVLDGHPNDTLRESETGEDGLKKPTPWTKQEDATLKRLVEQHGAKNWHMIAVGIAGKAPKSCRLRWINHLADGLRTGPFTPNEDAIVLDAQAKLGNKWTLIAKMLPGRSDNSIKNRWNSALRKRVEGLPLNLQQALAASCQLGALQQLQRQQEQQEQEQPLPPAPAAMDQPGVSAPQVATTPPPVQLPLPLMTLLPHVTVEEAEAALVESTSQDKKGNNSSQVLLVPPPPDVMASSAIVAGVLPPVMLGLTGLRYPFAGLAGSSQMSKPSPATLPWSLPDLPDPFPLYPPGSNQESTTPPLPAGLTAPPYPQPAPWMGDPALPPAATPVPTGASAQESDSPPLLHNLLKGYGVTSPFNPQQGSTPMPGDSTWATAQSHLGLRQAEMEQQAREGQVNLHNCYAAEGGCASMKNIPDAAAYVMSMDPVKLEPPCGGGSELSWGHGRGYAAVRPAEEYSPEVTRAMALLPRLPSFLQLQQKQQQPPYGDGSGMPWGHCGGNAAVNPTEAYSPEVTRAMAMLPRLPSLLQLQQAQQQRKNQLNQLPQEAATQPTPPYPGYHQPHQVAEQPPPPSQQDQPQAQSAQELLGWLQAKQPSAPSEADTSGYASPYLYMSQYDGQAQGSGRSGGPAAPGALGHVYSVPMGPMFMSPPTSYCPPSGPANAPEVLYPVERQTLLEGAAPTLSAAPSCPPAPRPPPSGGAGPGDIGDIAYRLYSQERITKECYDILEKGGDEALCLLLTLGTQTLLAAYSQQQGPAGAPPPPTAYLAPSTNTTAYAGHVSHTQFPPVAASTTPLEGPQGTHEVHGGAAPLVRHSSSYSFLNATAGSPHAPSSYFQHTVSLGSLARAGASYGDLNALAMHPSTLLADSTDFARQASALLAGSTDFAALRCLCSSPEMDIADWLGSEH
eukprot:gene30788-35830_t